MILAAPIDTFDGSSWLNSIGIALAVGAVLLTLRASQAYEEERRRNAAQAAMSAATRELEAQLDAEAEDPVKIRAAVDELETQTRAVTQEPGGPPWLKEVIVALIAATAVLGGTVLNHLLDDPEPVDCVAYVQMLSDLRAADPGLDPAAVFGEGGLNVGRAEDECGPPEAMFGS